MVWGIMVGRVNGRMDHVIRAQVMGMDHGWGLGRGGVMRWGLGRVFCSAQYY